MPNYILTIGMFLLSAKAIAARSDFSTRALYDGLAQLKLADRATSISCSAAPELREGGEPRVRCEVLPFGKNKSLAITGERAAAMLSALQSLPLSKDDHGASAEYVRCTRNKKEADREHECFVATLLDCPEDILTCSDH